MKTKLSLALALFIASTGHSQAAKPVEGKLNAFLGEASI